MNAGQDRLTVKTVIKAEMLAAYVYGELGRRYAATRDTSQWEGVLIQLEQQVAECLTRMGAGRCRRGIPQLYPLDLDRPGQRERSDSSRAQNDLRQANAKTTPVAIVAGEETRAPRRAARESVDAYYEARLAELLDQLAAEIDRYRASEIGVHTVDETLHHYSRDAHELWKY